MTSSREHRYWMLVSAFSCFVVGLCTMGLYRASSGLVYVEIVATRDVDREMAAWPISLAAAAIAFAGIVGGILLQVFSVRKMVLSAIVIGTSGLVVCFLSTSMPALILGYGLLFGTGVGLAMVSMQSFVITEVTLYKVTFNGLFKSSGSLGVCVLPYLIEWMIENYALAGTMLLLATLVLQSLVFGCMIRPFRQARSTRNVIPTLSLETETKPNSGELTKKQSPVSSETSSVNVDHRKVVEIVNHGVPVSNNSKCEINRLCPPNGNSSVFTLTSPNLGMKNSESVESPLQDFYKFFSTDDSRSLVEIPLTPTFQILNPEETVNQIEKPKQNTRPRVIYNRLVEVLSKRMFYVITLSYVAYLFMPLTYNVVIVDFGMDRGMSREKSIALLTVYAVAELVGRSGFGWVTDRGFLTKKHFLVLCDVFIAITLFAFTFAWNHGLLFFLSCVFGVLNGGAFVTIHIMYADYLRPEVLSIAMGLGQGFNILAFLARPAAIGLFRDELGSYDCLFGVMGGLAVISALAWLLEPVNRIR